MGPLKLYWWNETPNFGDRIAQDIVAAVSGREVIWASPADCELFAVGSLFKWIRAGVQSGDPGRRPWVWGSGIMGPLRVDFGKRIRLAAVRGPVTAALLNVSGQVALGDPGLLIPEVVPRPAARDGAVGIVAHHSMSLEALAGLRAGGGRPVRLVDVTQADHLQVVRDIAACDFVLSSSLHGLIVADAYGIPNRWLDPRGIHRNAELKFHDYALAVDRLMGRPLAAAEAAEFLAVLPDALPAPAWGEGVAAARAALRAAFPAELRG